MDLHELALAHAAAAAAAAAAAGAPGAPPPVCKCGAGEQPSMRRRAWGAREANNPFARAVGLMSFRMAQRYHAARLQHVAAAQVAIAASVR